MSSRVTPVKLASLTHVITRNEIGVWHTSEVSACHTSEISEGVIRVRLSCVSRVGLAKVSHE